MIIIIVIIINFIIIIVIIIIITTDHDISEVYLINLRLNFVIDRLIAIEISNE